MVPAERDLRAWIRTARDRGATTLRTGALFPTSVAPFTEFGFAPIDELALLARPVSDTDTRRSTSGTRPLRRRHLTRAARVDLAAFGPVWGNDATALADILHATPHSRARSVVIDRTIVGFAMSGVADRTGYLQRLAVDPLHHRRGAATTLIVDALAWMRQRGADNAMVNTAVDNRAALALYAAHGFERRPDTLLLLELRLDTRP